MVDLSTDVFVRTAAMPFGIAPTGSTRMMQSEGEYAGSQAAEAAGIPFTLSTMGTASGPKMGPPGAGGGVI